MDQQYLDQYELKQFLRRDATSEVWKAYDSQMHRYVSLTQLHFTLPTAEAIHHFLHETRGIVALQHPHLVPIFEVRLLSRTTSALSNSCDAYIVTDYIESLSLTEYIQTLSQAQEKSSPVEILHILAPIASAIDYLHQQGIIHGLIKPSSILFAKNNPSDSSLGKPRLTELGLHNTYDPHQLSPNDVCYIAPEIIQGYTNNVRSDLYSLGIILYEMYTGVLPFCGSKTDEVISQQLHVMPALPGPGNSLIEPELAAVIMQSLAKDPVARFSSASLMIHALAKALKVPLPQFSAQVSVEKNPSASVYSRTVLSPQPHMPHPFPTGDQPLPNVTQISTNNPAITANTLTSSTIHQFMPNHPEAISNKQDSSSAPGFFSSHIDRALQEQETIPPEPVISGMAPPPVRATPPPVKPKQRSLYTALIILIALGLLIASVRFFFSQPAAPQKPIVGHAFFVSSGLMDLTSARGIADGLQVHMENIDPPQSEKSYYTWLLAGTNNKVDTLPLLLGVLAVHNNQATLEYPGDANHSNLLSKYSHLLITEEDSNPRPVKPSLNTSTWRYSAAFSQTPDPQDTVTHFSLYDHLRHLLSQDPKIEKVGLTGGLDAWLYRNTLKILEWSGSARDLALAHDDTGLIRRQLVRILDYLDSSQYVQTENLPPDLAANPVLTDKTIARVGLLEISPIQEPPGYLKHIAKHLYGITQSPGVTPGQKQLAAEIDNAMGNVQTWLTDLHKDAEELIHKPADQLEQPETLPLFNAMFELANNAFVSQTDPHTGQVREGVAQIHYRIQSLATFDIAACTESNTSNYCT